MQAEEPIFVDDPAVLALIAQLAKERNCTEEEAIDIAVSAELAARRTAMPADGEA